MNYLGEFLKLKLEIIPPFDQTKDPGWFSLNLKKKKVNPLTPMTKREILLTISMQYQTDKWEE